MEEVRAGPHVHPDGSQDRIDSRHRHRDGDLRIRHHQDDVLRIHHRAAHLALGASPDEWVDCRAVGRDHSAGWSATALWRRHRRGQRLRSCNQDDVAVVDLALRSSAEARPRSVPWVRSLRWHSDDGQALLVALAVRLAVLPAVELLEPAPASVPLRVQRVRECPLPPLQAFP